MLNITERQVFKHKKRDYLVEKTSFKRPIRAGLMHVTLLGGGQVKKVRKSDFEEIDKENDKAYLEFIKKRSG